MNTIPKTDDPDWDEIYAQPIIECDEPLVPLSLYPEKILVRSAYFQMRVSGALPECYARKAVQERLIQAAELLPTGLRLIILDGWRSIVLQQALFVCCKEYYKGLYPDCGADELNRLTCQFIALPSTRKDAPSPHLTGGAIDLLLADKKGRILDFGAPFDYPGDISHTRYFEETEQKRELDPQEQTARDNRRLLYHVMTSAGFVNYHHEWWHFEAGTQRWAAKSGEKYACYGPAKLCMHPFMESQ